MYHNFLFFREITAPLSILRGFWPWKVSCQVSVLNKEVIGSLCQP